VDGQQLEFLRKISSQVDDLLGRLNAPGDGSAGATAPAPGSFGVHAAKLASILDASQVPAALLDGAFSVTPAQRGVLMLIEDGSKLRFKLGRNVDQQSLSSQEFQVSRSLIKQVAQTGEPVLWDPSSAATEPTSSQRLMKLTSAICVPLKYGARLQGEARLAGVIYLDAMGATNTLSEADRDKIVALAELAGVALENAKLFENAEAERAEVVKLKENIAKLYEVGRSISSTLVLDDLLVNVVDNVVSVCQAQRGFVMLLESDADGTQQVAFKVGRDATKRTLSEEHFAFSTTIARKTIDSKKAQVLKSALGGENGEAASLSMVQMKLQSIMCVPLIEKERVIGLVYVDSQQENREFTESDASVLESLCGQAAVAIVNAKLYGEAKEKERIQHELTLGAKIQADLLPKTIPTVAGLEIYGLMKPAKEVGGDYYDFIPHEGTERSITVCVGDVSGKGVGAGLVMAMARSALRSLVQNEKVPRSTLPLVQGLNTHLCGDIPKGMFMTLNVLNWDADTRKLKYTPAGHEHILIYRAGAKQVEKIKAGGVACGVLKQASAKMTEKEIDLNPGDHVILYTDGVTESMNAKNEEFKLDRLVALVRSQGSLGPKVLCEKIYAELETFRGDAEVHDDITLVALKAV
jgi:serine phosphatase RsbU (regulator of sigma subunit)